MKPNNADIKLVNGSLVIENFVDTATFNKKVN